MKTSLILLLLVSSSLYAETSYVRLYNFKSPYGVNWDSPRSLLFSVIRNLTSYKLGISDNSKEIGHSAIEVSCVMRDGTKSNLFTGMASEASRKEAINLIFSKNSGLGVLLHRFKGRYEAEKDLKDVIRDGMARGDINSITYLISTSKCKKLLKHNKDWLQKKAFLNYGLLERPQQYTGSGCSAYAMSFLKDFEIAPPEHYRNWKQTVHIDKDLIGPHNRQAYTQESQSFFPIIDGDGPTVFSLLFQSTWASPYDKTSIKLDFWSPDAMYEWVAKKLPIGENNLTINTLESKKPKSQKKKRY